MDIINKEEIPYELAKAHDVDEKYLQFVGEIKYDLGDKEGIMVLEHYNIMDTEHEQYRSTIAGRYFEAREVN